MIHSLFAPKIHAFDIKLYLYHGEDNSVYKEFTQIDHCWIMQLQAVLCKRLEFENSLENPLQKE